MKNVQHLWAMLPSGNDPQTYKTVTLDNGLVVHFAAQPAGSDEDEECVRRAYVNGVLVEAAAFPVNNPPSHFEDPVLAAYVGEEGKQKFVHRLSKRRQHVFEAMEALQAELAELDKISELAGARQPSQQTEVVANLRARYWLRALELWKKGRRQHELSFTEEFAGLLAVYEQGLEPPT